MRQCLAERANGDDKPRAVGMQALAARRAPRPRDATRAESRRPDVNYRLGATYPPLPSLRRVGKERRKSPRGGRHCASRPSPLWNLSPRLRLRPRVRRCSGAQKPSCQRGQDALKRVARRPHRGVWQRTVQDRWRGAIVRLRAPLCIIMLPDRRVFVNTRAVWGRFDSAAVLW